MVTLGADPATAYILAYWPELNNQPITISRYDMLYLEQQRALDVERNKPGGSYAFKSGLVKDDWYVPDMSKLATRVWWFYRACEYVRRGYESIHMGRMDIMLKRDGDPNDITKNNMLLADMMQRIKNFGSSTIIINGVEHTRARRGVVFFNSGLTLNDVSNYINPVDLVFGPDAAGARFTIPNTPGNNYDFMGTGDGGNVSGNYNGGFSKWQCVYKGDTANKEVLWDWGASAINMVEDVSNPTFWGTSISSLSQLKNVVILDKTDPAYINAGHHLIPPYNQSIGGVHPQNWKCDRMPYYVEWDCTNGYSAGVAPYIYTQYNATFGMDERTWFQSIQSNADRNDWLRYAYQRVRCLDKNAFLLMPGSWRGYYRFDSTVPYDANHGWGFIHEPYCANLPQYNVDGTIISLWNDNHGNHHPDRAERFVCVNKRDGTLWPSFPNYPAFWGGEKGYVGDFNRDGLDDLLATQNNDPGVGIYWNPSWGHRVYQTTTSGDDFDYTGTVTISPHPCTSGNPAYPYFSWGENLYVGDFDGDGFKNDVAAVPNYTLGTTCPGGVRFYKAVTTYNSTTGRNDFSYFDYMGLNLTFPSYGEKLYIGDFNGDGKDDILCTADNSPAVGNNWQGFKVLLNTSSGSTISFASPISYPSNPNPCCTSWGENFYIGDFNGDGLSDFMTTANAELGITWQGLHLFIAQNTIGLTFISAGDVSCTSAGCFPSWGERLFVGDYDADGMDDFIVTANKRANISWQGYHVFMNKSSGGNYYFQDKGLDGCNDQCCYPSWGERFNIGDFNGDNRSDFLVSSDYALGIGGGGWSMYRSKAAMGSWKPASHTNETSNNQNILYPVYETDNANNNIGLTAFPNPVNDKVILQFNASTIGDFFITIASADGKEVLRSNTEIKQKGLQTIEINTSQIHPGVFIYRAHYADQVYNGKIVKYEN